MEAYYRLRKYPHWAGVAVTAERAAEDHIEIASDPFGEYPPLEEYREEARLGCEFALRRYAGATRHRIRITQIEALPAHTWTGDVAYAACGAARQALGITDDVWPDLVEPPPRPPDNPPLLRTGRGGFLSFMRRLWAGR